MADSSYQPPRGADLDQLKARIAELQAKYRPVLDELSTDVTALNEKLTVAETKMQEQVAAAEKVGQIRQARAPLAANEASSIERLAVAENQAAVAAERRAAAEVNAARAAAESAAAVTSAAAGPARRQITQYATTGPFQEGRPPGPPTVGYNQYGGALTPAAMEQIAVEQKRLVEQVFARQQLQLPRGAADNIRYAGPIGPDVAAQYNEHGGLVPPGAPTPKVGPSGIYADILKQEGEAEKAAAGGVDEHTTKLKEQFAEKQAFIQQSLAAKAAVSAESAEFQRNAQRLGLANNAYQRNGYLTSEVINAAARGQVTFRELGAQVGGTIAKFGGWTAAAGLVYGAVGALREVGKGALDSESGVNQLSRVVSTELPGGADEAKQKFRELSHEFNLPISDVTEAVYGMAKAFRGDLPQAFEASKAALQGVKVGELSAADSTRYLTAIIAGFGLEGKQAIDVLDAFNQLQNKFGGNISGSLAGTAKLAGSFRAAGEGGEQGYLLASKLITAGVKTTGSTPENVGTAFNRSAGRVLTDAGKKALEQVGLDSALPYGELFAQALEKSKGANGTQIARIARALVPSGGQFARILVPILQNPDLLKALDEELAHRKGSAERERKRLLESPSERIKALGVNAQDLGSALGQGGVLSPLLAIVDALNKALEGMTGLLDGAERLAGPFKGAVVPVLELVLALKAAQKFGILGGANRRYGAEVLKGTGNVGDELARNYNRQLQTADTANLRSRAAGARAELLAADIEATADIEAQLVLAEQRNAALAEQSRFAQAAASASAEATFTQGEIAALEKTIAEFKARMAAGDSAQVAAMEAGILYRPGLGTKTFESPTPVRGAGAPGTPRTTPLPPVVFGPQTEEATRQLETAAAQEEEAVAQQSRFAQQMARGGIVAGAVGRGAEGAAGAARRMKTKIGGAASSIAKFAGALGFLDIALIAFIGIEASLNALHEHERQVKEAKDRAETLMESPDAVRRDARKVGSNRGFFAQLGHEISHPVDTITSTFTDPFTHASDREHDARKAHEQDLLTAADRLEALQKQNKSLLLSTIENKLQDSLKAATSEVDKVAAIDEGIRETKNGRVAYLEKLTGRKPSRSDIALTEAQLAKYQSMRQDELALSETSPRKQVAQLDLEHLTAYDTTTSARLQFQGVTKVNTQRLRSTLGRLRQLASGADGVKNIEAVEKLVGQMNNEAQAIVDRYVAAHPTTTAQGAARVRSQGVAQARRALGIPALQRQAKQVGDKVDGLRKNLASTNKEIDRITEAAAAERAAAPPQAGAGPIQTRMNRLLRRADSDKAAVKKASGVLRLLERLLSGVFGTIGQTARETAQATFDANQALYDANTALQAAQAGGGLAGDRVASGRAGSRLPAIAKQYGKNSAEYINAQADYINSQNSIADQEKQAAQDGRDKAKQAAQKAKQAAEQARQNAKALISAQADYAASLTTDPVKLAKIHLQEAQRLVGYAKGPAERLEAKADVNNRRREFKDAQVQSKLDDIDFYASVGRLSKDAEIAQLEALKKRIHGNKTLRRDIAKRLYDLKHDADNSDVFQLNVGDIKLPTIYDIRRLARQGTHSAPVTVQHTSHITVNGSGDPEATGAAVERHVTTGIKAGLRSVGAR